MHLVVYTSPIESVKVSLITYYVMEEKQQSDHTLFAEIHALLF